MRRVRRVLMVAVVSGALSACAPGPVASPDVELSPDIAAGQDVYGRVCAACHGGNGEGGTAPSLDRAIETFPTCGDHIRWIDLGTAAWLEEVGPTYGAPEKEITSVMPSFASELTPEEMAQVAAFQRVRFGDVEEEAVLEDCLGT